MHNIQRIACKECCSVQTKVKSLRWCLGCLDKGVGYKRAQSGIRFCATCDKRAPPRIEVIIREPFLEAVGYPPNFKDDTTLGGAACKSNVRRPDLGWALTDRVIFCEIDEHSHQDRESACELGKMWDQTEAVKKLLDREVHVVFVRFNPHKCAGAPPLTERIAQCAALVRRMMQEPLDHLSKFVPHVVYKFYSCPKHVDAAIARPDAIQVHSEDDFFTKK